MQFKLLVAAVALAVTAPAFALNPTATAAAINAGRVVLTNSNSAPAVVVYRSFRQLCQAGTIDTFTSKAVTASIKPGDSAWGNYLAYSCTLKASSDTVWTKLKSSSSSPKLSATPTWAGQNVAFLHTIDGGSIFSIIGMDSDPANQKPFIGVVTAGTTALTACASTTFTTTSDADPIWQNCATQTRAGQGGFSDVERQLFGDVLATYTLSFDSTAVKVTPVAAVQGFGVAVSKALYEALQADQGLIAAGCAASSQTVACQPTISKRQYASIVNSNPASVTKADWSWLTASGAGKNVSLCRRADTSGTQASSNTYFLGAPCAANPDRIGALVPAGIANGDASSTFLITEGAGTGNAKTCLNAATDTAGGDNWAVGVLSLENTLGATDTFRFVKVDGIAGYDAADSSSNSNVTGVKSNYDFAYEMVLHTHPTLTPATSVQILTAVAAALSNNTVLVDAKAPGVVRKVEMPLGTTRNNNSCKAFTF